MLDQKPTISVSKTRNSPGDEMANVNFWAGTCRSGCAGGALSDGLGWKLTDSPRRTVLYA